MQSSKSKKELELGHAKYHAYLYRMYILCLSLFVALVVVYRYLCGSLVVISDLVVEDASSQKSTEFQEVVYAMLHVLIWVTRSCPAIRLWSVIQEVYPYCPLCIPQSLLAAEHFPACQHQANVGREDSPSR